MKPEPIPNPARPASTIQKSLPPIQTIEGLHILDRPPVAFTVAHRAIAHNVRGAWKALSILQKTVLKRKVVAYPLGGIRNVTLFTPLYRPESSKPIADLDNYESAVIEALSAISKRTRRDGDRKIWLVDAGADIGMISAKIISQIADVEKVFAFEPNATARPFLEAMLASSGLDYTVSENAVGDFEGCGQMISPPEDPSEHARYVAPCADGPICVTQIDTLPSPVGKTVLLKVDVEGSETEVIEGARAFLSAADDYIVAFEAHPGVITRTGKSPDELVNILTEISPCTVCLAGDPERVIDPNKPLMAQIPNFESKVHNLICYSGTAPR